MERIIYVMHVTCTVSDLLDNPARLSINSPFLILRKPRLQFCHHWCKYPAGKWLTGQFPPSLTDDQTFAGLHLQHSASPFNWKINTKKIPCPHNAKQIPRNELLGPTGGMGVWNSTTLSACVVFRWSHNLWSSSQGDVRCLLFFLRGGIWAGSFLANRRWQNQGYVRYWAQASYSDGFCALFLGTLALGPLNHCGRCLCMQKPACWEESQANSVKMWKAGEEWGGEGEAWQPSPLSQLLVLPANS